MAYKNKTYICFDGDVDMKYYRIMQAWDAHDDIDFTFYNAHELTQSRDSSTEETIKRSLRERLKNSKELIVLIGENTKNLYRFVRWEMEVALEMGIPIIAVNLNKKNGIDSNLCPAIIRNELVVHVPFELKAIRHALKNWPENYYKLKRAEKNGPHSYNDDFIKKLAA